MAKKKTLDPKSLGIGALMKAHIKKERPKEDKEKEMRDLYSIAGKELLASGRTKDQRAKGGHEKARRLAKIQAPLKKFASDLFFEAKATTGKSPTYKQFLNELDSRDSKTHWEKYDTEGWWKKLRKGGNNLLGFC